MQLDNAFNLSYLAIHDSIPNFLTNIEYINDDVVIVTVRLITAFFMQEEQQLIPVTVQGSILVGYGNGSRQLETPSRKLENADSMETFKLDIDINPRDEASSRYYSSAAILTSKFAISFLCILFVFI